jgi:predicted transcriptional regulator with HTH domain
MSRLSKEKKQLISQQILSLLYDSFPKSLFTSEIAKNIVRDEEFTKSLLYDLNKKNLIIKINKNSQGINYLKRTRWQISNKTYDLFLKTYS